MYTLKQTINGETSVVAKNNSFVKINFELKRETAMWIMYAKKHGLKVNVDSAKLRTEIFDDGDETPNIVLWIV